MAPRWDAQVEARIFEEWPADAATWLAENGFAVSVLPEHNPLCTGTIAGECSGYFISNRRYYLLHSGRDTVGKPKNPIDRIGVQPHTGSVLVFGW